MTGTAARRRPPGLPINALALLVLKDDAVGGGWWQNWMRGAEQDCTAHDKQINIALSEAWGGR